MSLTAFSANFRTREDAIGFLLSSNLFRPEVVCGCGRSMELIRDRGQIDGVRWRCQCGRQQSVRHGSFLASSKLEAVTGLQLMFLWAYEWGIVDAAKELGVDRATISLHFGRFSNACLLWEKDHPASIGGPGRTVQIDETQLTKKLKPMGRPLPGSDTWILGGIDT